MNSRPHKQSMSELKLRRLTEHNQRLREDLARPRIRVSEASASLIRYCKTTKDPLVPSVWGPVPRADDPYQNQNNTGTNCCVVQ
ncbi:G-protein gamma subunit [Trametes polyzona]|nr:G-protein gamma subunit [Trametes polyzona]